MTGTSSAIARVFACLLLAGCNTNQPPVSERYASIQARCEGRYTPYTYLGWERFCWQFENLERVKE